VNDAAKLEIGWRLAPVISFWNTPNYARPDRSQVSKSFDPVRPYFVRARFGAAARPSFTKWRTAFENVGLSGCLAAHTSTACLSSNGIRTPIGGS
jgi:hypothetical protein